jgi:hypothetical protein
MSTSNRTRTPAETKTIENRLRRAAKRKGYLLVTAASSDTTAVVEPDSRGGRSDAGSRFDELVGRRPSVHRRYGQRRSARVTRLNCAGGLCVYIAEGLGLHRATR